MSATGLNSLFADGNPNLRLVRVDDITLTAWGYQSVPNCVDCSCDPVTGQIIPGSCAPGVSTTIVASGGSTFQEEFSQLYQPNSTAGAAPNAQGGWLPSHFRVPGVYYQNTGTEYFVL